MAHGADSGSLDMYDRLGRLLLCMCIHRCGISLTIGCDY